MFLISLFSLLIAKPNWRCPSVHSVQSVQCVQSVQSVQSAQSVQSVQDVQNVEDINVFKVFKVSKVSKVSRVVQSYHGLTPTITTIQSHLLVLSPSDPNPSLDD